MKSHDPSLSVEAIEADFWGDVRPGATRLVETVHQLRRKPIAELTTEDLRILIGQRVSLAILIPVALARLGRDPLLEGDFFPGDLLVSVLRAPTPEYWTEHPGEKNSVVRMIREADAPVDAVAEEIRLFLESWGESHS